MIAVTFKISTSKSLLKIYQELDLPYSKTPTRSFALDIGKPCLREVITLSVETKSVNVPPSNVTK